MSAAGTGTVYVVDDDPGVLRALTRLLRASGHEVESFDSPAAFLERHDPAVPGCLVLDLSMPELDGLALQNRLAAAGSNRPIVFISGHADILDSVRAMKAGAVDFLTKPFSDETLLAAIGIALERSRAACRAGDEIRGLNERLASLTAREREVFEHVVAGQLNKLIAQKLGAAEKTIKVHRSRVMHKMQAGSLADLVRMAERIGIGSAS
jgi:FixJ family two-component response regulator